WELSLSGAPAWTPLAVEPGPSARTEAAAVYDPAGDRMVVFGGTDYSITFGDVWALSLAWSPAWTELHPVGTPPGARSQSAAVYDAAGARMILFGGFDGASFDGQAWALDLAGSPAWSVLPSAPDGSLDSPAVYDATNGRMVVFGTVPERNEVWALD